MKKIYFNRVNVFLLHLKFSNSNKKSITKLVISVIQDEYELVKTDIMKISCVTIDSIRKMNNQKYDCSQSKLRLYAQSSKDSIL